MQKLPALVDSTLEIEGRVATLTLNRDDVRNEISGTSLVHEIASVVDWINASPEISAMVLTGAGRAFSAGGNVKHMRDRSGMFAGDVYQQQDAFRASIQPVPRAMFRLEVPSIAAINGPAIGAGFDLSLMCDLRIASDRAKFGETFVNLGLVPGDGGAWFLQRLVGYQRAAELAFSGRVFDADEALDMGLLLEIVAPEDLLARAQDLARSFAAKPPRTVRLTKRLVNAAERLSLGDFLDQCASYQGMSIRTEDHIEAINAMFEKREGRYSGT